MRDLVHRIAVYLGLREDARLEAAWDARRENWGRPSDRETWVVERLLPLVVLGALVAGAVLLPTAVLRGIAQAFAVLIVLGLIREAVDRRQARRRA
jgi:hypothetical protein